MKLPFLSFFLLVLTGCSSTSLILTPTQYTYQGKERTQQLDQHNPKQEPTISLKEVQPSIWGRKAVLHIQGWYSSAGLQARRIDHTQLVKTWDNDQLTISYYVRLKSGIGKESNLVYGYNYQQEVTIKIPTDLKQLNVKLIEQNTSQQEILSYQATLLLPHNEKSN